jgi:cellobiose-specific phosphotransferase system component IIC
MLSLAFLRYTQEKSTNVGLEEQSMTTKVFTKLRESAGMRYVLYIGVLITHVLIVFGLHGYIKDNGSWSTGQ